MFLLRKPILALSGSSARPGCRLDGAAHRSVVDRFIPGETTRRCGCRGRCRLRAKGLQVTLDHLGEDTTDRATADATVAAYLELIEALGGGRAGGRRRGLGQTLRRGSGAARHARTCPPVATPTRWPARGRSPTPPTPRAPG